VSLRNDIDPGVFVVPYAFRHRATAILGGRSEVAVRVEKPA
jgi:hypothetical protein